MGRQFHHAVGGLGQALVLLALAACTTVPSTAVVPSAGTSKRAGTEAAPTMPRPVATPTPADSGWQLLEPGLERRALTVPFPALGVGERLVLFRIDPAHFALRVRYAAGFPAVVSAWDSQARLVFNAGFFDESNTALGLLVSDGQRFGQSFAGFGGMLAVMEDGTVSLRSLIAQPHNPAEPLWQAVQGFPMLLYPDGQGGTVVFAKEDGARARRTALGLDEDGRLVLVIAPGGNFTLAEMADWLWRSDLALTAALNLDGGGSTGYYAGPGDRIDSFTPVPAVVGVYRREEN